METRSPTMVEQNLYETLLKVHNKLPNFWVSLEYWLRSGFVWVKEGDIQGLREPNIKEWILPPITGDGNFITSGVPIFANFPDVYQDGNVFLDYQFIYDPIDFVCLSGGKWETFRKNIRKFPARNKGILRYLSLKPGDVIDALQDLLINWAKGRMIFDPETFTSFVLCGDNRKGLFLNDRLIGVNVWDENSTYVNFRYCVDNGMPFLNEHLRYLFYQDMATKGKLVNDGGSLGSESLKQFKEKLNPKQILNVYSTKG